MRLVMVVCAMGCGAGPVADTDADSVPTWESDIQPTLADYCSGCHGAGACSTGFCWLDSYEAVMLEPVGVACEEDTRAACIPTRIHDESMPPNVPCPPGDPGCITFIELDQVERWVEAGAPEQ